MPRLTNLSTVTPVYRGADTIRELVRELAEVRDLLRAEECPLSLQEAIFVDDGSSDGSAEVLRELGEEHEWIRIVTLAKNFGQHPATMAGILHASGDWVATLDEDLQHRPAQIVELLQTAVTKRLDVVYADPLGAVHGRVHRDWTSRLFKWFVSKASGNAYVRSFNSFRLIRGNIARAASSVAAHQTYFDLALTWFTDRIGTTPLSMRDQRAVLDQTSGYRMRTLLSHGRRMLQSSNLKALRLGAGIGVFAMLVATIIAVYVLTARLVFPGSVAVSGWASVMTAVLFFGGLTTFLVGLVLENLSPLILQSHGKPTFFEVDRSLDSQLLLWFRKKKDGS